MNVGDIIAGAVGDSSNNTRDSLFSSIDPVTNHSNGDTVDMNIVDCSTSEDKFNNNSAQKDVKVESNVVAPSPLKIITRVATQKTKFSSPIHSGLGKRSRKINADSPKKKICKKNERTLDDLFKVTANCSNMPGDHNNTRSNTALESRETVVSSNTTHNNQTDLPIEVKKKLEDWQNERENYQKELMSLGNHLKKSREFIVKILKENTQMKRDSMTTKIQNNNLKLGQMKDYRHGTNYEQKCTDGTKFADLERRRKKLESEKEENEKERKMLNKCKPGASERSKTNKQKQTIELEPAQYLRKLERIENNKNSYNRKDKELLAILDKLKLKRVVHLKESKRFECEELSRYRDFPILNDRYMLLSLLGRGGFSEVYKAIDLDQINYVAIKIHELNPRWPMEKKDSYIKHAIREVKIHEQLEHEHIVRVHDVFNIDNDSFCTALEYVQGDDLDSYLKQNENMCEKEAKSLICQIISALHYLNDRKNPIIHYDLKPGNILLCNNGEIKITDFGLSKIFPDDHHNPDGMELTSQGAGTYWYLPPECFVTENGPPTISSKVDVWSVGVIFYQTLYGKKPFGHNMSQTDIFHNNTILNARQIEFPLSPRVSDAAKDFIRRCCTYDKHLRPDVFQIYGDQYLKNKNQLKLSDSSVL